MENQKTLEEIKIENELLTKQLAEFNERLKGIESALVTAKEYNTKLAFSTRLFAETHLTLDEKMSIAQELNRALSAEQVERIYNKYKDQICPPGVETEGDFVWSPGFIRELERYYFTYKGYNPFEVVDMNIKVIRSQFRIEEDLRIEQNPEKVKALREAWNRNREASLLAIDEILSVTNEILKK